MGVFNFDEPQPRERSDGLDSPAGTSVFQLDPVQSSGTSKESSFIEGCLLGREMERLRIARELHDSTGQLLIALKLNIARFRQTDGAADFELAIEQIDEAAQEIEAHIRAFSFLSCPASLQEAGLAEALRRLAIGFGNKTGLFVAFQCRGDIPPNPSQAAQSMLRVAQEALVNVYRHACASSVRVTLENRSGRIRLSVEDDGRGFPSGEVIEGVGLDGMRQRMASEGGSLDIHRLPKGTLLVASMPVSRMLIPA